jgi:hypothetical protein
MNVSDLQWLDFTGVWKQQAEGDFGSSPWIVAPAAIAL